MTSLSLPLAFIAGLLSILSPCVFSLIPLYLGYLSGASLARTQTTSWRVMSHALAFVGGFTLIFVIVMGLPTTLLSGAIQQYSVWITRLGGLILIIFGLHTMQIINIPMLNVTQRAPLGQDFKPGYARSVLLGITFAAGWSPCVGPLLGMVMTLAFNEPAKAMIFLLAYALGIATPFLLAAALLSRVMIWIERLAKHSRTLEFISGGLMIIVGVLLLTGLFTSLNNILTGLTPYWLIDRL